MPTLLDVVSIYPIASSLAENLPVGSLIRLSRASSSYRLALHGFLVAELPNKPDVQISRRSELFLGGHETSYWKLLKSKSLNDCSEPRHTKGNNIRACKLCSIPVCDACIVRASFQKSKCKSENTFSNRCRHLCKECWSAGNPHRGRRILDSKADKVLYFKKNTCECSAKDIWLCIECKTKQNEDVDSRGSRCWGEGCCDAVTDENMDSRRICLWCDLPLHGKPTRQEMRRQYDSRHLQARHNSSTKGSLQSFIVGNDNNRAWYSDDVARLYDQLRSIPYNVPPPNPFENAAKAGGPRRIQHLGVVNYDSLGTTPPDIISILNSLTGNFVYNIEFLLAFRPFCKKEPSPSWWRDMVDIGIYENGAANNSSSEEPDYDTESSYDVLSNNSDMADPEEMDEWCVVDRSGETATSQDPEGSRRNGPISFPELGSGRYRKRIGSLLDRDDKTGSKRLQSENEIEHN
ncbi:MAG: hypothetical protein M1834_008163 [Cirrosporium novae-zelandiae]|nr:MAG: hypothetical protein M1834_008163 [Cirrosporium novae-zelandiae]